jgi:hypothetical protein
MEDDKDPLRVKEKEEARETRKIILKPSATLLTSD